MSYKFYGCDSKSVSPINPLYNKVKDQRHLYDLLSGVWCEYTCAPRLRKKWSKDNKTCGACSITCLLVQDIFGGEIYGVYVDDDLHCFSKVGDVIFDLTSEQFGDKKIDYTLDYLQSREEHLANKEKKERYLYLVNRLLEKLK